MKKILLASIAALGIGVFASMSAHADAITGLVNTGAGLKYPQTVPASPALIPADGRVPGGPLPER